MLPHLVTIAILLCSLITVTATPCNRVFSNSGNNRCFFTHELRIYRYIPWTSSPSVVYQRCLDGWRDENLGLPLLPPIIVNRGHPDTGEGLVLMRIPPAALLEGIVNFTSTIRIDYAASSSAQDSLAVSNSTLQLLDMHYKVLNPSWITWPVEAHAGCITFSPAENGTGCLLTWRVQWTPLTTKWIPLKLALLWNAGLEYLTRLIVNSSADHVVKEPRWLRTVIKPSSLK
jgi:hypothetical protein